MEPKRVSKSLLTRLPAYLTYIKSLPENTSNISATRIAKALNFGDVMVRKDLAKISCGGRRRTGYVRESLIRDIESYLDVTSVTETVIVGVGKLGQALLEYGGFEACGLEVIAGFDRNPDTVPETTKPVYPMSTLKDFCREHKVRIGIITVPGENAQKVCDQLVDSGIQAIWNFAPVRLETPEDVVVQSENLAVSLTALRMQLKARDEAQESSPETAV